MFSFACATLQSYLCQLLMFIKLQFSDVHGETLYSIYCIVLYLTVFIVFVINTKVSAVEKNKIKILPH